MSTTYLVFLLRWSGPFRDTWEFIGFFQLLFDGSVDWGELFSPYGGAHRIVIPKLLFYLDFRFFAASNYLTCVLALSLQACSFFIYYRLLNASVDLPRSLSSLLAFSSLLFLFSTTQLYNLLYAMDVQWFISTTCALLAFSLIMMRSVLSAHIIFCSFFLGILAAFSNSTGLFILPALVLCLLYRGYAWRKLFIPTLFMLVFIYFYTFQVHSTVDPVIGTGIESTSLSDGFTFHNLLATAFNLTRYLGLYLASPLSRDYPLLGWLLAMASLIYLARFWFRCLFKGYRAQAVSLVFAALASYIVLAGLATSWGRMYYPNSSTAERFQTIVLQFQYAMLCILVIECCSSNRPVFRRMARFFPVVLPLFLLGSYQLESAREAASLSNRVNNANTAIISGLKHIKSVRGTLSHPLLINNENKVAEYYDFLQQNRLGMFNDWPSELRGKPLTLKSVNNCEGRIFSKDFVWQDDAGSGIKIRGRAINSDNGKPLEHLVISDSKGMVTGFGRLNRPANWFGPNNAQPAEKSSWTAYLPEGLDAVNIYALDENRQHVCLVAGSVKIP